MEPASFSDSDFIISGCNLGSSAVKNAELKSENKPFNPSIAMSSRALDKAVKKAVKVAKHRVEKHNAAKMFN